MLRSYTIFPELEERIQNSGLLERYPELHERALLGSVREDDILEDIQDNPLNILTSVNNKIPRLIDIGVDWVLSRKGGENPDLFGDTVERIKFNLEDILLGTSLLLPYGGDYEESESREFDYQELDNYQKYGFSSKLEMIISLGAYRMRNILSNKRDEYTWTNSQGIKNIITACIHGDTKFYQYKEVNQGEVYSPFGIKTLFIPRKFIGAMNQIYHSHEPRFFATFFRYAYETGKLKDIMGDTGEKFIKGAEKFPCMLGNYADAGTESHADCQEMLFLSCIPIGGSKSYRNVHTHTFAPNYRDERNTYYESKVSREGNLEMWNMYTGNRDMIFYPEDCEHLLQGILHQCAYGHGRTSKSQILKMVQYVYSDRFRKDAENLDLPQL